MELMTLTSLSPFAFDVVNCRKNLARTPQRMRCKLGRSALPEHLTIISKIDELRVTERRSANYHPSIWKHEFIESLSTPYTVSVTFMYIYEHGRPCLVIKF